MLTGNRRELSRATSKFDNIGFSSATRNLQIRRIQDKSTLWRGFRCRFRLGDLLISCGRKADSCKKKFGSKNIRVLVNGAVPTWKLYWCVLTERNSCLWLPPGDMAVRVLLECVTFLGRWCYITTGPLSAYQSHGGEGGSCPPELLSRTNQVCGWICSL